MSINILHRNWNMYRELTDEHNLKKTEQINDNRWKKKSFFFL